MPAKKMKAQAEKQRALSGTTVLSPFAWISSAMIRALATRPPALEEHDDLGIRTQRKGATKLERRAYTYIAVEHDRRLVFIGNDEGADPLIGSGGQQCHRQDEHQ
ncbi:hypothetical protein [Devosia riboflavina]